MSAERGRGQALRIMVNVGAGLVPAALVGTPAFFFICVHQRSSASNKSTDLLGDIFRALVLQEMPGAADEHETAVA